MSSLLPFITTTMYSNSRLDDLKCTLLSTQSFNAYVLMSLYFMLQAKGQVKHRAAGFLIPTHDHNCCS